LNEAGLDHERSARFETWRPKDHDGLVFRHRNSSEDDLDLVR
jgi:hypothetical protein